MEEPIRLCGKWTTGPRENIILFSEGFSVVEIFPIQVSRARLRISAPRSLRQIDSKSAVSLGYKWILGQLGQLSETLSKKRKGN